MTEPFTVHKNGELDYTLKIGMTKPFIVHKTELDYTLKIGMTKPFTVHKKGAFRL